MEFLAKKCIFSSPIPWKLPKSALFRRKYVDFHIFTLKAAIHGEINPTDLLGKDHFDTSRRRSAAEFTRQQSSWLVLMEDCEGRLYILLHAITFVTFLKCTSVFENFAIGLSVFAMMSNNDALAVIDCVLAANVFINRTTRVKKRVRRIWCKEWMQKRKQFSHTNLLKELNITPKDWHNYL